MEEESTIMIEYLAALVNDNTEHAGGSRGR
jgi:hypothetical protein